MKCRVNRGFLGLSGIKLLSRSLSGNECNKAKTASLGSLCFVAYLAGEFNSKRETTVVK